MPQKRDSLERQLERTRAEREAYEGQLEGVPRRDPYWRSLNATVRRLEARLRAVGRVEAIGAENAAEESA